MLSLALVLAFLVILLSCFQLTRPICKLVHKGNSTDLLLIGTLLTSSSALFNMHILIQRGLITYVGNGRYLTHNAVFSAHVLDYFVASLESGLYAPVVLWDVFPLDDARGVLRKGDCDYGAGSVDTETAGKYHRYLAHVGEGVDSEAENEFKCLSNSTLDATLRSAGGRLDTDIISPKLALVHALGLSEADFDKVAERGAMVVWSPRSNVFLYGKTLNVSYLLSAGITVALGTDWLPSGSATMGREAACARDVMSKSHGVELEAKTIWEMMTINAARVTGFERSLGSIEAGKMADIVVFGAGEEKDQFAQAVYAGSETIELVVHVEKVILAGAGLERLIRGDCEKLAFGEAEKTVCVEDEIGMSFAQLEKRLGGVYPAVLAGKPKNEPTCESTR